MSQQSNADNQTSIDDVSQVGQCSKKRRLPALSPEEASLLAQEIDLERFSKQMQALKEFGEYLSTGYDAKTLLKLVPMIARQALGAEAASLQLYDPDRESLVFYAVDDPQAPDLVGTCLPVSQSGINNFVLRIGLPEITHDVRRSCIYNDVVERQTGRRIESLLTVPIKSPQNYVMGVMQVLTGAGEYWEYDLQFLQVLATLTTIPLMPYYEIPQKWHKILQEPKSKGKVVSRKRTRRGIIKIKHKRPRRTP